jgi:hypothetical protein
LAAFEAIASRSRTQKHRLTKASYQSISSHCKTNRNDRS